MNSKKQSILITLRTVKAYVLLSRSMQSPYYFKQAQKSLALAKLLIQKHNSDKTVTIQLKLVA